ncbi:MAG TPA: glycine zipper family protein [Alphaproteobacteria bacterium]|nr:glycine zipper family protein [Alphaproteobacteria bacterium]
MATIFAHAASAQNLMIYPARGQDQQTQDRDRFECHSWAVQQTGFDPTRASAAPAPPPPPQGGLLRGAARGAAVGAVGGAIGGNAGKGAAIGAGAGAMVGGIRQADQQRQFQQQQQAQAGANAAGFNDYNRAMAACLQGRGYTVN